MGISKIWCCSVSEVIACLTLAEKRKVPREISFAAVFKALQSLLLYRNITWTFFVVDRDACLPAGVLLCAFVFGNNYWGSVSISLRQLPQAAGCIKITFCSFTESRGSSEAYCFNTKKT